MLSNPFGCQSLNFFLNFVRPSLPHEDACIFSTFKSARFSFWDRLELAVVGVVWIRIIFYQKMHDWKKNNCSVLTMQSREKLQNGVKHAFTSLLAKGEGHTLKGLMNSWCGYPALEEKLNLHSCLVCSSEHELRSPKIVNYQLNYKDTFILYSG